MPLVSWSMPAHRLRSVTSMQLRAASADDLAHPDGVRGVPVVALDDRPAVDRDDVPLLEHVAARGSRARSWSWARCRSPPGSRGSRGSSRRRPGARARRGRPGRAPGWSRPAWRRPGSPRASRPRPCRPGASWPARPRCASRGCPGPSACCRRASMAPTTRRVTASGEPVPLISASRLTLLVPAEQRGGLLLVEVQPAPDGLLGVVLALDHLTAAHVAGPVHERRGRGRVVGAAVDADPARGEALHDQVGGDLQVDHQVEAEGLDDLLQRLGLAGSCGGSRRARSRARWCRARTGGRRPSP